MAHVELPPIIPALTPEKWSNSSDSYYQFERLLLVSKTHEGSITSTAVYPEEGTQSGSMQQKFSTKAGPELLAVQASEICRATFWHSGEVPFSNSHLRTAERGFISVNYNGITGTNDLLSIEMILRNPDSINARVRATLGTLCALPEVIMDTSEIHNFRDLVELVAWQATSVPG